jgi:hypothetical protein
MGHGGQQTRPFARPSDWRCEPRPAGPRLSGFVTMRRRRSRVARAAIDPRLAHGGRHRRCASCALACSPGVPVSSHRLTEPQQLRLNRDADLHRPDRADLLIRRPQVRILPGALDLSVDQRRRERRLIHKAPADSATRTPIHPAKRSSDDGCIVSGSSMTMRVPRRGADAGRAGRAACVPPLSPGTRPCARRGAPRPRASACARAGTCGTGRRSGREPSRCRCERRFRSRARRR